MGACDKAASGEFEASACDDDAGMPASKAKRLVDPKVGRPPRGGSGVSEGGFAIIARNDRVERPQ